LRRIVRRPRADRRCTTSEIYAVDSLLFFDIVPRVP
jgi:hypothetical protein